MSSLLGSPLLGAAFSLPNSNTPHGYSEDPEWKIPPYLKPGDTIGITCTAGFMTHDQITGSRRNESWDSI